MLKGVRHDTIPSCPGWNPLHYDPRATQVKRQETNERASRKRPAYDRHLNTGDQEIILDRRPGWKFQTSLEPGVCTVISVTTTIDTVQKGAEQVRQNILWLRKVPVPEDPSDKLEPSNNAWDVASRVPETIAHEANDTGPSEKDETSKAGDASETQKDTCHSHPRRPGLRPNPLPSKRLKDYLYVTTN
ncbi:hypothetical protein NDU88_004485 [Pleurodeles waltl]|uniref:Uncharacterized protein n=1 Tax=Pleurodeles waltl TaxID=8319 RepID=A0AAV7T8M8_PLEWA|nr:hypothetical protein NDU88_004485 [Pleurodeles waltl]